MISIVDFGTRSICPMTEAPWLSTSTRSQSAVFHWNSKTAMSAQAGLSCQDPHAPCSLWRKMLGGILQRMFDLLPFTPRFSSGAVRRDSFPRQVHAQGSTTKPKVLSPCCFHSLQCKQHWDLLVEFLHNDHALCPRNPPSFAALPRERWKLWPCFDVA